MRSGILFIASFLLCFGNVAWAEQSLLYYVLDGSGSMWGRVEGRKIKIQVAKDVMADLVKDTPANMLVGVSAYGHRKKGDCTDIEEIVPIGVLQRDETIGRINGILPKGKTPIAESIKRAVGALKSSEAASTIVLISDGIETCDADPCAVTKALKESGVEFVLHVVGFDVGDAAAEQLNCIADAGGGKYFSSANADELLSSLKTIKSSVVEKKAIVVPTPEPTATPEVIQQNVVSSSKSIRIKASGPGRVLPVYDSWLKRPYMWQLIEPESGEVKVSFKDSLDKQLVPAGEYQVQWHQARFTTSAVTLGEVIRVEPRKTTELNLKTGVRLNLPTWVRNPYRWSLREPGVKDQVIVWFEKLEPQLVPSGDYELVWHQSRFNSYAVVPGKFTVKPDMMNELKVASAINLAAADWVEQKIYAWGLKEIGSDKWAAGYQNTARLEPQIVPPGKYRVIYHRSRFKSWESDLGEVEIKEGELTKFVLNTGVKIIAPSDMEPPYLIEFIELDNENQEVRTVRQEETFAAMPLKPGKYRIKYQQKRFGSSKFTLVDSFDLPAGSLVELEM